MALNQADLVKVLLCSSTPLPTFGGGRTEDLENFIRNFDQKTAGWGEDFIKLRLPSCLTGPAQQWYLTDLTQLQRDGDWVDVKDLMRGEFDPEGARQRVLEQLGRMRFDPNRDEAGVFLRELKDLFVRVRPAITDEEVVFEAFRKLPAHVEREILRMANPGGVVTLNGLRDLMNRASRICTMEGTSRE